MLACRCLPPHRAPIGARALPQGESGECVCSAHPDVPLRFRDAFQHPGLMLFPSKHRGGWRAEKRKPMVSATVLRIAAGASRRAPIRSILPTPGPAFRMPGFPSRSATPRQGLLMVPGGAPVPPECLVAQGPQAPHPVPPHERLMRTPLSGRGGLSVGQVWEAGIKIGLQPAGKICSMSTSALCPSVEQNSRSSESRRRRQTSRPMFIWISANCFSRVHRPYRDRRLTPGLRCSLQPPELRRFADTGP